MAARHIGRCMPALRPTEPGDMIKRITLDNYMSHSHTVIEPADGLTVLVGENNCGKSAVVSALQTLCFNRQKNFMRKGSCLK